MAGLISVRLKFLRYRFTLSLDFVSQGVNIPIEFLPFLFQDTIAVPHLKHDYHAICNLKPNSVEHRPVRGYSKLSAFFHWLLWGDDSKSGRVEL